MAFVPITNVEIATGEPVTTTLQDKIQDNFDDHESRLQDLEAGSAVAYPPIILGFYGRSDLIVPTTNVIRTTINFDLTINNARLIIDTQGTAGTTQVDVQYKRGVGAWTSIFTTKPGVSFGAGNDAVSTNQVLNLAEVDLEAGDLIRLNIDSSQTTGSGFMVRIDYTKT